MTSKYLRSNAKTSAGRCDLCGGDVNGYSTSLGRSYGFLQFPGCLKRFCSSIRQNPRCLKLDPEFSKVSNNVRILRYIGDPGILPGLGESMLKPFCRPECSFGQTKINIS
jgi:hypothetical protein